MHEGTHHDFGGTGTAPGAPSPPRRWSLAALLVGLIPLAGLIAAGCSSSPGSGTPGSGASTSAPTGGTSGPSTSTTSSPAGAPRVTVSPATGLRSPQAVLVVGSGFSPGESLVVTECADKGAATGAGDCDLGRAQSATSGPTGEVRVQLTVTKGPFGTNAIVCGATQPCLVSVTQASLSPSEEADQRIAFG